jgi:hypothetical protein
MTTLSDKYTYENGKRYRKGFAPSELMHPIEATCSRCGGRLVIYPAGAVCDRCSPAEARKLLQRDLDRRRMQIGAVPESEL